MHYETCDGARTKLCLPRNMIYVRSILKQTLLSLICSYVKKCISQSEQSSLCDI